MKWMRLVPGILIAAGLGEAAMYGGPCGWTQPVKILDASELEKSKWCPQVVGLDAAKRETDKRAGRVAWLFVAGLSQWEVEFLRPGEKPPFP